LTIMIKSINQKPYFGSIVKFEKDGKQYVGTIVGFEKKRPNVILSIRARLISDTQFNYSTMTVSCSNTQIELCEYCTHCKQYVGVLPTHCCVEVIDMSQDMCLASSAFMFPLDKKIS